MDLYAPNQVDTRNKSKCSLTAKRVSVTTRKTEFFSFSKILASSRFFHTLSSRMPHSAPNALRFDFSNSPSECVASAAFTPRLRFACVGRKVLFGWHTTIWFSSALIQFCPSCSYYTISRRPCHSHLATRRHDMREVNWRASFAFAQSVQGLWRVASHAAPEKLYASLGSARLRSWAFLFANRRLKGTIHSLRITASYLAVALKPLAFPLAQDANSRLSSAAHLRSLDYCCGADVRHESTALVHTEVQQCRPWEMVGHEIPGNGQRLVFSCGRIPGS